MTIRQLIERLSKFNGDEEIYLSIDAEGNSFATADDVTVESNLEIDNGYEVVEQGIVIWPI